MAFRALNLLLAFSILLVAYQNCGGAGFSGSDGTTEKSLQAPFLVNNSIPHGLCDAGKGPTEVQRYYPTSCLRDPHLGADSIGFEMNQLMNASLELPANDNVQGTANETTLYLEIATYHAPDTIVINAQTLQGVIPLLNICNVSTMNAGDPTKGLVRPPSNTILQFAVKIPRGTLAIKFDLSGAATPTYIGVWNLNEFSAALGKPATNPFNGSANAGKFRVRSAPPARYNDVTDPQVCAE